MNPGYHQVPPLEDKLPSADELKMAATQPGNKNNQQNDPAKLCMGPLSIPGNLAFTSSLLTQSDINDELNRQTIDIASNFREDMTRFVQEITYFLNCDPAGFDPFSLYYQPTETDGNMVIPPPPTSTYDTAVRSSC